MKVKDLLTYCMRDFGGTIYGQKSHKIIRNLIAFSKYIAKYNYYRQYIACSKCYFWDDREKIRLLSKSRETGGKAEIA